MIWRFIASMSDYVLVLMLMLDDNAVRARSN